MVEGTFTHGSQITRGLPSTTVKPSVSERVDSPSITTQPTEMGYISLQLHIVGANLTCIVCTVGDLPPLCSSGGSVNGGKHMSTWLNINGSATPYIRSRPANLRHHMTLPVSFLFSVYRVWKLFLFINKFDNNLKLCLEFLFWSNTP